MKYEAEYTDTFQGEANYCWVKRFVVESNTMRGAIVLANKAFFDDRRRPRNFRKSDFGDSVRLDFPSINTCAFITEVSAKQNWFETLNAALESEGLVDQWPLGTNIGYGETVRVETEDRLISVSRETDGRYERPVHYKLRGRRCQNNK